MQHRILFLAPFLLLLVSACEATEPQWLENAPEASQQGARTDADAVPAILPDYGGNAHAGGEHGGGHR